MGYLYGDGLFALIGKSGYYPEVVLGFAVEGCGFSVDFYLECLGIFGECFGYADGYGCCGLGCVGVEA